VSDTIVTTEYIEAAKSRDERVRAAVLAIDIETALRSGEALRVIIDTMAFAERETIENLIACPPDQMGAIAAFQAQVRAYVRVRECLQDAINSGKRAEMALREEATTQENGWA